MRSASQPFTWRDLLVLAFITVLVSGLGLRAIKAARDGGNRVKCASNLRNIGQSIQIYANANKGALPRTVFVPSDAPVPTAYTGALAADPFGPGGPGPNDVTAPLFLILRDSGLASEVFVCPSTFQTPWNFNGGAANLCSNFPNPNHLSYGYANPYPSAAARKQGFKLDWTLTSDFAIAADMAPGPVVAKVPPNASPGQMAAANSRNHPDNGQNVLYADIHVDWATTVFAGMPRPVPNTPRDNIYAYGADLLMTSPSAGTDGPPMDQFDSVILPHAGLAASLPVDERYTYGLLIVVMVAIVAIVTTITVLRARRKRPPTSVAYDA